MYKLNLDPKYCLVISDFDNYQTVSLYIEEKFKKFAQDIFYEVYYVGRDIGGYYCPYVPLTYTGLSENQKDEELLEKINNDSRCIIDHIFYWNNNNDIKTTEVTYKVNICTHDKKIYSKLKLIL